MTKQTIKKTSTFFLVIFGFFAILFQKGFGTSLNTPGGLLGILQTDIALADTVAVSCGGCASSCDSNDCSCAGADCAGCV